MKVPVAQPLQLPAKIRKPVAEIFTAKASIGSGACGGNASNGITINASVNLRDLPVGRYFSIESMNGSIEERIRILRSFVATRALAFADGIIMFSTTDMSIVADILYLVRGLGGVAFTTDQGPIFMTKITFRLPRSIRLSLQRSQGNANDLRLQDISTVAIENVEKLDPCEMVCIKTTNPSSLYVTDDFVVTHNTSLLTFLAAQAARVPRLRTFLLDRHNGMKIFTTVSGGRYITFDGSEQSAALNPFHLPHTAENRKFLHRWLRSLAGVSDPRSDEEIARAISVAYDTDQPLQNRSLARLSRAAFSSRSDVRRNLEPWINPDAYGRYFNADIDNLDLADSKIIGFEMTNILNDEKLAPAIIDYLVHRIRTLSIETTDPTLVIIDETKPMLAAGSTGSGDGASGFSNSSFRHAFVQTGLMEGRKLRQGYNLCFQTPQALIETGMAQVVLDQCQKIIFYRNPRDSDELAAQYEIFGLNKAEIDFVAGRTYREWPYAVLIKSQITGESSIVDVNLSRLGPYLGAFESDVRQVSKLNGLMEHHDKDEAVKRYFAQRSN